MPKAVSLLTQQVNPSFPNSFVRSEPLASPDRRALYLKWRLIKELEKVARPTSIFKDYSRKPGRRAKRASP